MSHDQKKEPPKKGKGKFIFLTLILFISIVFGFWMLTEQGIVTFNKNAIHLPKVVQAAEKILQEEEKAVENFLEERLQKLEADLVHVKEKAAETVEHVPVQNTLVLQEKLKSFPEIKYRFDTLKKAMFSGMAFETELQAIKKFLPQTEAIQKQFMLLEKVSTKGIKTYPELQYNFQDVRIKLRRYVPEGSGLWKKIKTYLGSLFVISREGETITKKSSKEAIASQIEQALKFKHLHKVESLLENLKNIKLVELYHWKHDFDVFVFAKEAHRSLEKAAFDALFTEEEA